MYFLFGFLFFFFFKFKIDQQLPKSLSEKGEVLSGMFPAWRSPRVSDTSPAVVPKLIRAELMSALADDEVVP